MLLFCVSIFTSCILAKESGNTSLEPYSNKYKPEEIMEGTRIIHKFPKHLIEVTLSFGVTNDMIQVAEVAVIENFTGSLKQQGEESRKIAEEMERVFGGYWSVAMFEDPYVFSWTIIRRSPSFLVLDVNGAGIAIAREGGTM